MLNHQLQVERRKGQHSRLQMINATVIIDQSHLNEARLIISPNDGSVVCLMKWFIVSIHICRPALLQIKRLCRAVLALHHRQQPSSNHARRLVRVLRHVTGILFMYPAVEVAALFCRRRWCALPLLCCCACVE